jgi:cyanuric acid amidohydrolase
VSPTGAPARGLRTRAVRFDTRGPSDITGLEAAFERGELTPESVVCLIGKTEGNGGRNDFTRELAIRAFSQVFERRLGLSAAEVEERIVLSFSGGTEGVVTPHVVAFAVEPDDGPAPSGPRLAIGVGMTRVFEPHEIGRLAQVDETARAVTEIAARCGIAPADVHLVQMKGAIPSFSYEEGLRAERAGRPIRSNMVWSRAASALGVAVATGEVARSALSDDVICQDWSLFSTTASCSAKPGLERTELVVFGQSSSWGGDLVVDHTVLSDMLDSAAVDALMARLGLGAGDPRLVGAFAKSEADPRGTLRGHRHTMLTDDDISDTRYSRCVVASVVAARLGDPRVYVSTRAEHHGPEGGGPLALVVRAT